MIARLPNDAALHSDAMNFLSFTQAGVDPRTGQYTLRLDLPALKANDLRDIEFPLVLAFSPLTNANRGYGLGWELKLSQFNPNDNMLTLQSGESFLVTGEEKDTHRLTMLEQKLQSFHAYREGDSYRIVHRSGVVEILEMKGSGLGRRAMPVSVVSPLGHALQLDYTPVGNGYERLKEIRQANGEPVFAVSTSDGQVTLAYNPYVQGGPTAMYKLFTPEDNKLVKRIELPTNDNAGWKIDYREQRGLWCVDTVATPAGATEKLYYTDEGHLFPGDQYPALPRVTRHVISPQSGQTIDNRYTYPNDPDKPVRNNFLGYGVNIDWSEAPGLDALYQYIGVYSYGSVQAVHLNDSATPARTTERRYNQFHLQTLEKITQGDNVAQVVTEYELYPDRHFSAHPRTCHLPTHSKRTWWNKKQSSLTRTETESRTYDAHGNLFTLTKPNKVEEISEWWPASEAEGHPEDPEGFVRHLKSKTIKPAPHEGTGAKASTLVQRFNYMTLPPLDANPVSALQPCHLLANETLSELVGDKEVQLEKTVHTQTDLPGDPLRHGRVQMRTITRGATFTVTTYTFEIPEDSGVLVTQETTMGFDGASATVSRQEALLTGHVTRRHNADGVQSDFEYDALGRQTSEIVAPDTDFVAKRTWQYFLNQNSLTADAPPSAIEPPGQTAVDEYGVTTRTYIDGLGRAIKTARDTVDAEVPRRLFDMYSASYDSLGNLIEETVVDLLGDSFEAEQRSLTTTYTYDDWGQRSCTTGPDGVEHHEQTDPIGGTQGKGPVVTQWRKSKVDGKVSGQTRTSMNLFEKPTLVERLDAEGKVLATSSNRYDGLGRCIEASDERHNKTVYIYDPRDRLRSTTLPDSTKLEHSYAEHSGDDHPVGLTVTPMGKPAEKKTIISQTFDGLLRLTARQVGGRTETYQFENTHTRPSSRTTPGGAKITYDYAINLSPLPTLNDAPDDKASFTYHPLSAALSTASNAQGTRSYKYNASNQLIEQSWAPEGSGKTWVTEHKSSLAGRELKRTDPDKHEVTHTYDPEGRVKTSKQGLVETTFDYDDSGRLEKTTTKNLASGGAISVTRLEYDDQDREEYRYENVGSQPQRVLFQEWGDDDLLKARTLSQNGTTLLHESFFYDDRMRLTQHQCEGSQLPLDPFGQPYTKLIMTLDGYDNVATTTYTIKGNATPQRAIYKYRKNDPCQLDTIQFIGSHPGILTFTYDADGNLQKDERDNTMVYDRQGRLLSVTSTRAGTLASYRYDASGDLHTRESAGQSPQMLFFQGNQLTLAIRDAMAGGSGTQLLYAGDQPLAQQSIGDASQTILMQSNMNGSVIAEYQGGSLQSRTYSSYGALPEAQQGQGLLAYNGELREPGTGWYLLGRGARAFNPLLMRFHSPDSLCALDEGGSLNPYAYCNGNPVTLRDPTGQTAEGYSSGRPRRPDEDNPLAMGGGSTSGGGLGWGFWLGIGLSVVSLLIPGAALLAAPVITAAMVVSTVVSTVISAVATASAIAAGVLRDATLEAVSTVAGALAFLFAMGGSLFSRGAGAAAGGAGGAGGGSRSGSFSSQLSRASSFASSSIGRSNSITSSVRSAAGTITGTSQTPKSAYPGIFVFSNEPKVFRSTADHLVNIANRQVTTPHEGGKLARLYTIRAGNNVDRFTSYA
jgi:RHS repeat-associated protein